MPLITAILLIWAAGFCAGEPQPHGYFIPTSDLVRVAWMAAHDDGYNQQNPEVFLDRLQTADGKEPFPGYTSIGLYKRGFLIRSYAVRIETGDVVDTMACEVLRYPDLLRFGTDLMRKFGTKPVSAATIASEIGCDALKVVPAGKRRQ